MGEKIHHEDKYCVLLGDFNLDVSLNHILILTVFLVLWAHFIFNPKFCSQPELQITLQLLLTVYFLIPLSTL